MTMPHLMNCPHMDDGWCLDCVAKQWEELQALRNDAERYRRLRDSPIADVRIIGVGKRSGAGLDEAVDTMYTAPAVG